MNHQYYQSDDDDLLHTMPSMMSHHHQNTCFNDTVACNGFCLNFGESSLHALSSSISPTVPTELQQTPRISHQDFIFSPPPLGIMNNQTNNNDNNGSINTEYNIDTILAEEINRLSFQERELVCEDIHGVSSPVDETEELIHKSLVLMQEFIDQKIVFKPAYDMAMTMVDASSRNYISSRKFRLMFLRADRFQVEAAAQKLVEFLQCKVELFGLHTLGRSLYLSDLDADDLACLKSGAFQLLPQRDRAGRVVIVVINEIFPEKCYKRTENMMKVAFYISVAAVEDDEESQKKGVVGLSYVVGGQHMYDLDLHSRLPLISAFLPCRYNAIHFCTGNRFAKLFLTLINNLGRNLRVRIRFHNGSHTECRYSLMTYGIPIEVLPLTYDGEAKTTNHFKWLVKREMRDHCLKACGTFDGIDIPTENDVLAGRGRKYQNHSGNIVMRNLLAAEMKAYEKSSVDDKVEITKKIVQEVKRRGGRFLKADSPDGWWRAMSDEDARRRVSRSARTFLSFPPLIDRDEILHKEDTDKTLL